MIGIVVPAHDEAERLDACLLALAAAATHPALAGEPVKRVVVLDSCSDGSGEIARRQGVDRIVLQARNVGRARAAGAEACLAAGARWLAFTDADSVVAPDWLAAQLALGCDAVCGTVGIGDWGCLGEVVRRLHEAAYRDADGHRHVHGANLGLSAEAYLDAGGFPPLGCHEDVALVAALQARGRSIAWSAAPRVWTSARRDARCRGGFGDTLWRLAAEAMPLAPGTAA